ncbi:MAG TPA: hypothetical protein PKL73_14860 [Polyangiaceae bacterium]|nr:MAG: hypothetical protein BWY17_00574 [Deltaproteobacteria bacterium ADurb.Bin207]HNS98229.1 hypothetical protein [Polyangiaceae bacterium]HNZ23394.1 hypothetical protein [Polyangiaceae bacterium]HOD22795.1 hypothetical protein [Polyangiaceae bacterium]HOE49846.1 hypothetical protein [Polyangiaceae bacterium]
MRRTYSFLSVLVAGTMAFAGACGDSDDEPGEGGHGAATGGSGGSGETGGSGGSSETGGSGGSGETEKFVHSNKIDILFMIDNSASMGDKQKILAAAVPDLVERLINPICVNPVSREFEASVGPEEDCPTGTEREFEPVVDIHIGVITSSLGGHGADSCSNVPSQYWNPTTEDMAHLITRGKNDAGNSVTVDTYQGRGFLNWDPTGENNPPGENNAATLKQDFTNLVRGADQTGCGYESSLEAWRRFLVDPAPYEKMVPVNCPGGDTANRCRGPEGVDQTVLQQRKDFLRPDSLVAIVMLTDENDCSVIDGGQYYLALQMSDGAAFFHLARGTEACQTDPWSPDCKSCWEVNPTDHPECAEGWASPEKDDPLNLRCWDQKRRFGIDFLYPVQRYVKALTDPVLENGTVNPLFCGEPSANGKSCQGGVRDRSQVVLTGIVGVPWQDLAVDPTDLTKGYRTSKDIDWDLILGDPQNNVKPTDPLMMETVEPRTGSHPLTGQPLSSEKGLPNAINGAERLISSHDDLQYACIFELGAFGPIDCNLPENKFGCDCNGSPENPLCWNGSSYGTTQYRAKAYPGLRHLSVLKDLGSQGVVASICPSNMTELSAADYGYRPAFSALVRRLSHNLR